MPLPPGIERGAAPQRFPLEPAAVERFEAEGVILVRGALAAWVDFLREVADFQVCNPNELAVAACLRSSYDYCHLNSWMTNNGIHDFLCHSAVGHILAQLGRAEEVRIVTDNLLVNPRSGIAWHQDTQTGPVDVEDALRFWAAVDPCGPRRGAPEFLIGSHQGGSANRDLCLVDVRGPDGKLPRSALREFSVEPGDLLVWHARAVHRLMVPTDVAVDYNAGRQRRVISGTAVRHGTLYWRRVKSGVLGDASGHDLCDGEVLQGPYFPQIFPDSIEAERQERVGGRLVPRSRWKILERKMEAQFEALSSALWPPAEDGGA